MVGVSSNITSISLSDENAAYLERVCDNNSAFINRLLDKHRQGSSEMEEAIARHRREQLQSELNQIENRREAVENELEHVEKKLTTVEKQKQSKLEEAREALETVELAVDNPAVEHWAGELGMSEQELIDELEGDAE